MVVISIKPDTELSDVLSNCKDVDEFQETLKPLNIDVTQTDDARIHFRVNQFDTSIKKHKIHYQCKGLVLDGLEQTALAIPGRAHSYYEHVDKKKLKEIYDDGKYKIIKARDGTSVTLYHFNGSTYMSTGKCSDVSSYYWEGEQTFAQMFYESAQTNPEFISTTELKITETGNISWNVPENYSITLGFRHHNIHKNGNDNNAIWLVRCVDRNTGLDIITPDSLNALKTNEYIDTMIYDEMVKKCERDQFVDQKENFYGYILICTDPDVQFDLQRVFISSTLYKTLQHFFYSFTKDKNDQLTHNNRYLYSIFRNILLNNSNYIKLLCKLDSDYVTDVQKYNIFINNVISKTCTRLQDAEYGSDDVSAKFMDQIINQIKKDEADVSPGDEIINKLVSDYVRSHHNAKTLVDLYIIKMQ